MHLQSCTRGLISLKIKDIRKIQDLGDNITDNTILPKTCRIKLNSNNITILQSNA